MEPKLDGTFPSSSTPPLDCSRRSSKPSDDFAAWQRGSLPAHLGPHRAYWRAALREGALPPLEMPLDFARPARQTFRGGSVAVALPAAVAARLEAAARAHGCTLFQLVLALWALLLCRHAGQEEVVVGAPYHGRDAPGTEGLIGYFVNVLPLRVAAARGGTVGALLRAAREAAAGGMAHAALPFQQLVHEELPRRVHDASRNAVFQAMLAWEEDGGWGGGAEGGGVRGDGTHAYAQQAASAAEGAGGGGGDVWSSSANAAAQGGQQPMPGVANPLHPGVANGQEGPYGAPYETPPGAPQ